MTAVVTAPEATLAYDVRGAGAPIVLVHGLTFDRTAWTPIIDRLAEEFCCISVDLPGHGDSAGPPAPLPDVAGEIHRLLESLGVDRPVVVGHSMGAIVALLYAAAYPVAGVVDIDQPLGVGPFVERLRQLESALRGETFAEAFEPFRRSIGVDDLPEPERTRVAATWRIEQRLVMGYWDEVIQLGPEPTQQALDAAAGAVSVPFLGVFGHDLDAGQERRLLELVPQAELELWPGRGHLVHLVEPDRFAWRLASFARHCADPGAPYDAQRESNRALVMGIHGRCMNGHDLSALALYTDNPRLVESITRTATGFPDATFQVEWLLAEGDMVAGWTWLQGTHLGEWRGLAPTGRRISARGSLTVKIAGGKVVDFWVCADWLRMFDQLGALRR